MCELLGVLRTHAQGPPIKFLVEKQNRIDIGYMTHIKSEFKKDITNSCPVHARWPRNQKLFILFRSFVILIINSLLVLMLRPQFQIGFAIKFRFIKESHVNTAHVRTANQNLFNPLTTTEKNISESAENLACY